MNQTFERTEKQEKLQRVTERRGKAEIPIRHLFRRQYQNADGNWSTIYYAIFTDWKGRRRKFALGSELGAAKDALAIYEARNVKKEDFDQDKLPRGMTVAQWLGRYLDLAKNLASYGTKQAQCLHLKRLLGNLQLSEVNRVRIIEYKNRRLSESLIRHGEAVDGTRIKGATVNREVSCLIAALNLAADAGLCEGAPVMRRWKEREIPRERTLTDDELKAILNVSAPWLQRVMIAANETAIDQEVLLRLTWDSVQSGLIAIKGGRDKTGARQRVGISPELQQVLEECKAEYRHTPNIEKRVFTRGGKPILKATLRSAFDRAIAKAKIEDFQFRDFRHCARTRWAAAGLPYEVAETAIGHKLRGIAGRYINLSDDQIREAFQGMFTSCRKNDSVNEHDENAASF